MASLSKPKSAVWRDKVYEYLREAILTGQLEPNSRLKESYYSKLLGVSRTPVRDALRLLEKDGLAVYIPQRGTFVRGYINEKEIQEMFTVRKALQIASVDNTIDNVTDEDIANMQKCNEICKQAIIDHDYNKYAEFSHQFEITLIRSCKMDILISILLQLEQYDPRFSFVNANMQASILFVQKYYRCEAELREQIDILESIRNKDREQLREMIGRHLLNTKEAYLRAAALKG